MPIKFFEVEHSTDINNSLLKFVELQDFCSDFLIVEIAIGRGSLRKNLELYAFQSIEKRVQFWSMIMFRNYMRGLLGSRSLKRNHSERGGNEPISLWAL